MITINEIKSLLRSGKTIFADQLKDPKYILRYLARCEKLHCLTCFVQNNDQSYLIYAL